MSIFYEIEFAKYILPYRDTPPYKGIGTFPDGNSALMLVCARLRHVAASEWGSKRYMDMEHLFKMEIESRWKLSSQLTRKIHTFDADIYWRMK